MKKALISLTLLTLLVLPLVATGQEDLVGEVAGSQQELFVTINSVINYLFAFLMIGAVIVILIAAFNFLTAAGDPDKTKKARDYIVYAIVAIVVGFLAKAIVLVIGNMIGADTGGVFF